MQKFLSGMRCETIQHSGNCPKCPFAFSNNLCQYAQTLGKDLTLADVVNEAKNFEKEIKDVEEKLGYETEDNN